MPLLYSHQINEATKIGVWHITEKEDFFLADVNVHRNITHPHKRLQHLAGRYLLKELFPDFPIRLIEIADTRKPFLVDEAYHFSISHCGDYAAVIVSTKNRVGVDIEILHPKIENIKHKFLSEKEQRMLAEDTVENYISFTMAWSIKEAMFKWYSSGEVDFIKHMEILYLKKSGTGYQAYCNFTKDNTMNISVQSMLFNDNILSWIIS